MNSFIRFPPSLVCTRDKIFFLLFTYYFPPSNLSFNFSEKHIIEGKKSDRQTLDIDLITFANSFPPSIDCFCLFSGRLLKCLEINFLLFLFILTVSPNLEKKTQTKETSLIYLNVFTKQNIPNLLECVYCH